MNIAKQLWLMECAIVNAIKCTLSCILQCIICMYVLLCVCSIVFYNIYVCSCESLLTTTLDSKLKGCEFKSQQEWQENFLLQSQLCVLTLIQCQFHPMLPQWHIKDPGHSAKSAGGRLHQNTHTALMQ